MGFLNIFKLSLHNLKNNKLRTLLTIIVLSVVSVVIVFVSGVGYSFYSSVSANINDTFNTDGAKIRIDRTYFGFSDGRSYQRNHYFTIEEIDAIVNKLDDDSGYITSIKFFSTERNEYLQNGVNVMLDNENLSLNPFYAKSNPFIGKDNYLESGRMWDASDQNTNNIWLSSAYMRRYSVGETIKLKKQSKQDTATMSFVVQGFLNVAENSSAFIEYHNFNEKIDFSDRDSYGAMAIQTIGAHMTAQKGFSYGIAAQNYFKEIVKDIEDIQVSNGSVNAICDIVESLKMIMLLVYIVFGLIAFISVIIILLSIGSVANTIKISAEQNRKFFGVMKAIGMKNKSLRSILTGQIIIMTILGVTIASIGAYLSIGIAESMLEGLISSMFYGRSYIVICSISPIIPIAVALILIGFVLLFTRTSLHQFSKMDVITVINEVN